MVPRWRLFLLPLFGATLLAGITATSGVSTFLDNSFRPELPGWPAGAAARALVQPDGKVIVGGLSNGVPVVARLNADGSKDSSFRFDPALTAIGARHQLGGALNDIALQPDGKILLTETLPSTNEFLTRLVRVNSDGSMDAGFHSGIPEGQGANYSIHPLPDGRIFVAGDPGGHGTINGRNYLNNYAQLLSTNGTLLRYLAQQPFQNPKNGADTEPFISSVALQPDGKLLVAGQFNAPGTNLVRLNQNFTLDTGFQAELSAVDGDLVTAVALQSDGKILVAIVSPGSDLSGFGGGTVRLVRLLAKGKLEADLTPTGLPQSQIISSMTVLADDRVLIATASNVASLQSPTDLLRLTRDGAVDIDFGANVASFQFNQGAIVPYDTERALGFLSRPGPIQDVFSAAAQPVVLARFFIQGSALPGVQFADPAYTAVEGGPPAVITLRRSGDLSQPLSVHYSTSDGTARAGRDYLSQTGTVQFGANQESSSFQVPILDDAVVEENQRTVRLSLTEPGAGTVLSGIDEAVLLITDNESATAIDPSFNPSFASLEPTPDEPSNDAINFTALQSDGKIVVLAQLPSTAGNSARIVRLNPDGTLDASFHNARFSDDDPASTQLQTLALQPDGQFLVGGTFTEVDGLGRTGLVRLKADGSVDGGFAPNLASDPRIAAIAVQTNGQILVGGAFSSVNSVSHNSIVRLNPDGSVDEGFQAQFTTDPGRPAPSVNQIGLLANGQVLVGGDIVGVDGRRLISSPVRLNSDGTLDDSFIPDYSFGDAFVTQADGKLLTFDWACLRRFNSDGTIDQAFQFPCLDSGPIQVMAALGDGGTLVIASRADGSMDLLQAGAEGQIEHTRNLKVDGTIASLAVDAHAGILIGGAFSMVNTLQRHRLARLLPLGNSSPSVSWSATALAEAEDAGAVSVTLVRSGDTSGSLTVDYSVTGDVPGVGTSGSVSFAPLESAKTLVFPTEHDPLVSSNRQSTFQITTASPGVLLGAGPQSVAVTIHDQVRPGTVDFKFVPPPALRNGGQIRTLSLQEDGKVLVSGVFASANSQAVTSLERLNTDGSLDASFDIVIPADVGWGVSSTVTVIAPHLSGRIVVAGTFTAVNGKARPGLARLQSNGALDESFDPSDDIGPVGALAVLSDERVLIAGVPSSADGQVKTVLALLKPDGQTDTSFVVPPELEPINLLLPQPDEKILATTTVKEGGLKLVRLTKNGALDSSFQTQPVGGLLTLLPDGKIVAADQSNTGIIRLNPDGSVDHSFVIALVDIASVAVQTDGRIVVAPYSSVPLRFNADGSPDLSFQAGAVQDSFSIVALAIQADGKVIIGGGFTALDGVPRANLARLNGDPELRLVSLKLEAEGPSLTWVSLPGRQYAVERSVDLRAWTNVQTTSATGYSVTYQDSLPSAAPSRFYRVQRVGP